MGFLEKGSEKGSGVKPQGIETLILQTGRHNDCQVCRFPSEQLAIGLTFLGVVASHWALKRWECQFPAFTLVFFWHKCLGDCQGYGNSSKTLIGQHLELGEG